MASGFNNSFEKAFNPGMAIGANAALETIKEKIKQEEEVRQGAVTIDYLKKKIIASAEKGEISADDIASRIESLDKLKKSKLSSSELSSLVKMGNQDVFGTQFGSGEAVTFDPATGKYSNSAGDEVDTIRRGQTVRNKAVSADFAAEKAGAMSEASTKAKEEVQLDYPTMDDKSKSAVSAYKFISPRVEKLNGLIDSGIFGKGGAERLTKQIIATPQGELVVPDGSPLEELVGLYNDIKLTGFNIAGTAFTGTEKETAFALLDPRNKSDKRIKRDLASFQDLFATRVESGVEGLRGAKKTAEDIKSKRGGQQDDGYEYKTVNGKPMRRKKSG